MALKGWEADLTRELLRMLWRIDRMPREHKGRLMRKNRLVLGGAVDSDERIAWAMLKLMLKGGLLLPRPKGGLRRSGRNKGGELSVRGRG